MEEDRVGKYGGVQNEEGGRRRPEGRIETASIEQQLLGIGSPL